MMLRCINPNEAKLLDAAAGVHVRFRLAGVGIVTTYLVVTVGCRLSVYSNFEIIKSEILERLFLKLWAGSLISWCNQKLRNI